MKKILPIIVFGGFIVFGLIYLFFLAEKDVNRKRDFNVLLITLDTTRADRIGCYGFNGAKTPNLDRIASKGVKFSNAYCQVPLTLPSHCSILTGTYPFYHRVHSNGSHYLVPVHLTLAEKLKESGFETAAFVSSFTVDSRFGLDQGFDVYDDTFDNSEVLKGFNSERRADEVFASFSSWIDAHAFSQFFCWVHFFDPHAPYDPPSPYKEKFPDSPYDGEISFVDDHVGKIVRKLEEKALLGKTHIVLVGDHGEAFGEKRERDHGLFIYDVTMKVPFIIYSENTLPKGVNIEARVRLIDVMPTVLDMLEIPQPDEIQGTSLLPYIEGKRDDDLPSYIETYFPREYYGWSELMGLIAGEWKYIQAPKPELYNLKKDPQEEKNSVSENEKLSSDLREKLKETISLYAGENAEAKRRLTLEEKERLLSLGYAGEALPEDEPEGPRPDPKDGIKEQSLHFVAKAYEDEGDLVNAALFYEKILHSEPDVPWNYVRLSDVYSKMNRWEESIQTLEEGRGKTPGSVHILSRLSASYFEAQRYQEAFQANLAILSQEPRYFNALFMSGIIMKMMQKWPEALDYFERAVKIEPENAAVQLQYAYCLGSSGKTQEALVLYDRLKRVFPGDYRIYQDLGVFLNSIGRIELAQENFRQVVELNPSPEIIYNYAVFLEKTGKLKEAIHFLELYLESPPEMDSSRKAKAEKLYLEWKSRL